LAVLESQLSTPSAATATGARLCERPVPLPRHARGRLASSAELRLAPSRAARAKRRRRVALVGLRAERFCGARERAAAHRAYSGGSFGRRREAIEEMPKLGDFGPTIFRRGERKSEKGRPKVLGKRRTFLRYNAFNWKSHKKPRLCLTTAERSLIKSMIKVSRDLRDHATALATTAGLQHVILGADGGSGGNRLLSVLTRQFTSLLIGIRHEAHSRILRLPRRIPLAELKFYFPNSSDGEIIRRSDADPEFQMLDSMLSLGSDLLAAVEFARPFSLGVVSGAFELGLDNTMRHAATKGTIVSELIISRTSDNIALLDFPTLYHLECAHYGADPKSLLSYSVFRRSLDPEQQKLTATCIMDLYLHVVWRFYQLCAAREEYVENVACYNTRENLVDFLPSLTLADVLRGYHLDKSRPHPTPAQFRQLWADAKAKLP